MNKFIGKSIRRKFVKNANERGHKFSEKNLKVRFPSNSKMRKDSVIICKECFMHIRFRFPVDEKYWRLDSPRGRKFGVIDTPPNFRVQPLYLRNASNDPQFFYCCIQRPNISQASEQAVVTFLYSKCISCSALFLWHLNFALVKRLFGAPKLQIWPPKWPIQTRPIGERIVLVKARTSLQLNGTLSLTQPPSGISYNGCLQPLLHAASWLCGPTAVGPHSHSSDGVLRVTVGAANDDDKSATIICYLSPV